MSIIVEKYGGSSLATIEQINSVAHRVVRSKSKGHQMVIVVSAMGKTTDNLISLAKSVNPDPKERELGLLLSTGEIISASLLSLAIHNLGYASTALTGAQAGIYTEGPFDNSRISSIHPGKINDLLDKDEIVIVTGFQGIQNEEITVLGRGGSDATAVALASSLGASSCFIYTDVQGVYTADPNLIPSAELLDQISYNEMIDLSAAGAKVLMENAVEIARDSGIKIVVGSSFEDKKGTLISSEE
jgi:aspartate kinase